MCSEQPLVLILCGHCGVGKSSTANLLLGQKHFVAQRSAAAVTSECHQASTVAATGGREIIVIDTPGLTDPESSDVHVHSEIIRGVAAAADEYREAQFAVVLMMSLAGRVDETVIESFKELKRTCFGHGMHAQSLVVWTHGDLLLSGAVEEGAEPLQMTTDFCGECGRRAVSKFCTGCGASLLVCNTSLPVAAEPSKPPAAAPPIASIASTAVTSIAVTSTIDAAASLDAASLDARMEAYLAGAGGAVSTFLSSIAGTPVVLCNPQGGGKPQLGRAELLSRVVASASGVAGPAALIAPPKRRGKVARRERQLALAVEGRIGRVRPLDEGEGDVVADAIPGLVGLIYRWWYGDRTQRTPTSETSEASGSAKKL